MLTILLISLFSHTSHATQTVDWPAPLGARTEIQISKDIRMEFTIGLVEDQTTEDAWVKYWEHQLSEDLKKNPKLHIAAAGIEDDEEPGRSASAYQARKRVRAFIDRVIKGRSKVKIEKVKESHWDKFWKEKGTPFLKKNGGRLYATVIRFFMNGGVNGTLMMMTPHVASLPAVWAGAALIGSTSAAFAWNMDFVADKLVGNGEWSKSMFKNKPNSKLLPASVWLERLFRWGLFTEIPFVAIIELGFHFLGLEELRPLKETLIYMIVTGGLSTLTQGVYEETVFNDRNKQLKAGVDPARVERRSQLALLFGSMVSVCGVVVSKIYGEDRILGQKAGHFIMMTLAGIGAVNFMRVEKEAILKLGDKILNRCSRLLRRKKDGDVALAF